MDKKIYTYQQAYDSTLDYFKGDTLATEVWLSKYAWKTPDEKSFYELNPNDMWDRMAKAFFGEESKYPNPFSYDNIRGAFSCKDENGENRIRIIPGGSVLAGLGKDDYIGSLSNCLVVERPEDSYAGIMKSREQRVQLMKRRCGVGVDISSLRPSGASVNNPAKSSTGPVSFMDVDSALTNEVAQNGRRGALMITISCKHPDVLDFIKKKQDLTKVTGANISVQLTGEFIEAARNNEKYVLRWPCEDKDTEYNAQIILRNSEKLEEGKLYSANEAFDIIDPDNDRHFKKSYFRVIDAKAYWDELIHCAWNTGEPGIMFKDTHILCSPDGAYEQYRGVTTNPCGEIFMGPFDSCRLISINLSAFVKKPFTYDAYFDFEEFSDMVKVGLHLSDDLVDAELKNVERIIENIDPKNTVECELWEKIKKVGQEGRRCGLGITALGDMIAMMGLKYDSEEALELVDCVMSEKYKAELDCEMEMADNRGKFVGFSSKIERESPYGQIIRDNAGKKAYESHLIRGRRNVSWSTVAPTGSLSLLTQTTSGIEPLFSPYYVRRKKCSEGDRVDFIDKNGMKFTEYLVVHPQIRKWFEVHGANICEVIGLENKEISQYTQDEMSKIYEYTPWFGSTANDIDSKNRVKMQSVIQKYITHSISSTVNLPNSATEADVSDIYINAFDYNLKGITVYRDGCRDGVFVTVKEKECDCKKNSLEHDAPKRPKILTCDITRFRNNKEKWVAAVGLYEGQPYEIFTGLAEKLDIPDYVEKGEIIKNKVNDVVIDEITGEESVRKVSRYDLRYVDENGEKVTVEGINTVFNKEFWNYGKLIAGILRHGMRIDYIINVVKSLSFDNDSINSWKNGVARTLKTYCADGEVKGEVCPECGGKVIRENGCKHCANCTWSACQ